MSAKSPSQSWSSSDISQLIALIQETNHLYNIENPDYSVREAVDAAWVTISERLGKPVRECRDRWYNLRTVYRRQLRESHTLLLNTGRIKNQRWVWKDSMSFLLPYLRLTGPSSYLPPAITSHSESTMPPEEQNEAVSESLAKVKFETLEVMEDLEDFEPSSPPAKRHCSDDDASNDPLRRESPSWEQPSTSSVAVDADEMFLRSLVPDMKTLSPRNKALFRMKVQQALFDCMFPDDGKSTS